MYKINKLAAITNLDQVLAPQQPTPGLTASWTVAGVNK